MAFRSRKTSIILNTYECIKVKNKETLIHVMTVKLVKLHWKILVDNTRDNSLLNALEQGCTIA